MLSIRKNLLYNFLLSASQVLLPLISIPYVSRVLSPDGIGQVSFIDSFTYYFINIAEFGLIVYGMREVAQKRNDTVARDKLVSELLALHLVTSAFAILLYSIFISILWHKVQDIRLVIFSLGYLVVNSFACEWYFLGMEKFRYLTIRSLTIRVLGLVALFLLVKGPPDYYLYYGIIALSAIVIHLLNTIRLFREVKVSFRKVNWKYHLKRTQITYAISLVYCISLMLDNVLLHLVSNAAVVGIYAFSAKILRTASVLLTDTLTVFFPRIVVLGNAGDETGLREVLRKNLQLIVYFAIPLCTGIALLAGPLVRVALGPQFEPAITNVQILAIFPLLRAMNLFYCNQILIARHKEKLALISFSFGNGLFIPLTLLLSWQWGYTGAAIALVAAEAVVLVTSYYFARSVLPGADLLDWKGLVQAMISSVVFIPLIWLGRYLQWNDGLQIISGITLCVLVYMLVQLFLLKNEFAQLMHNWLINYLPGKRYKE